MLTLEVEQDIGLIVLEHLSNKLNIHILDIDLLCGMSTLSSGQLSALKYLQTFV